MSEHGFYRELAAVARGWYRNSAAVAKRHRCSPDAAAASIRGCRVAYFERLLP